MTTPALDILYIDDSIVVLNKPAWLLSVPGKGPDKQDCLASRVQALYPRAENVHRLDCATSGVIVMALTRSALRELNRQFHDREVSKTYTAVAMGKPKTSSGTATFPLIADWPNRPKQKVDHERGKQAITHWQIIEPTETTKSTELTELTELTTSNGVSTTRFLLNPITGRSHQLRVHLLTLGHPILGDRLYAPSNVVALSERLLLHATRLVLTHPVSGESMQFDCPCPF